MLGLAPTFLRNDEEFTLSVQAAIFGHLVQMAKGTIDHYHGDLLHDALFIHDLPGECEFYWGFRKTGTDITRDVEWAKAIGGIDAWFKVEITKRDRDCWYMQVIPLEMVQ